MTAIERAQMRTLYLCEMKKPGRVFANGDLVIGMRIDGGDQRLVCAGYSTKVRRMVFNYGLHYQSYHYSRTAEGQFAWKRTGAGHLRILEAVTSESDDELEWWWNHDQLRHEFRNVTDAEGFVRELTRLCGGNFPQTAGTRQCPAARSPS
ncbi:MAG: hypothetical protein HY329_27455 [Chloroflexi bacterium]|nr:hypothetical protein [Chloroflexota bacterium]